MNYLAMDRASEAAANDLAEVRKLIEGMNALVNSQIQQQQQAQQAQQQQTEQQATYPATSAQLQETIAAPSAEAIATAQHSSPQQQSTSVNAQSPQQELQTDSQMYSNAMSSLPQPGVIVEVTHLTFTRTLYFQLSPDATIEPMVGWLRLSFQDAAISGMVLQYKGFDGLWKCLLNRDDSLRRILKQSMKGNTMLQMRVPREQDLLSSGYTDRRLLALTKPAGQ
ncbi:hypothetical protein K501DRAFT_253137 [Backusella circina FSU 941]|nr:hypothetical protein K501DRAFT_253137 [Backusella circina FSU 941]